MGDEPTVDRNDPELKYLTVEKNQFNDPATQAEWTQKRLVWVPHETQVRNDFVFGVCEALRRRNDVDGHEQKKNRNSSHSMSNLIEYFVV